MSKVKLGTINDIRFDTIRNTRRGSLSTWCLLLLSLATNSLSLRRICDSRSLDNGLIVQRMRLNSRDAKNVFDGNAAHKQSVCN